MGLYWLQTLGCPKNQVDSDKLEGYLGAQGYAPCRRARRGRPRGRQHVRIHRGRPPGVDRHGPGPGGPAPAGARLVVTGCMAERYGDELRDALPEVDLVAGFGRAVDRSERPCRRAVPVSLPTGPAPRARARAAGFDLLELPRPAARALWAYVKVAEGCDRICGFCAIPSFRGKQRSRSPEEILAEVDASPRAPRRRRRHRRCARSSSWRRTWPPTAATVPGPGRRDRIAHGPSPIAALTRAVAGPGRAHPPALPLSLGPDRRADRGGPRYGRALLRPLAPARLAPAAAAHAPLGRRRALPAPHRGHPGRRRPGHVPLLVHPRLPGRDRARPRPAPPVPRGGAARLGRLLPLLQRGRAPTPPAWRTRSRPSSRSSVCASAPSCRTPSPRPSATASSGEVRTVLVDAPGRGPHGARGARDRRRRPPARTTCRSAASSTCAITGAEGPDLHAVPVADRTAVPAGAEQERTRERRRARAPAGHPGFTFGPSALVTPANAVTVARLLAAPVYVRRCSSPGGRRGSTSSSASSSPAATGSTATWPAATAPPARAPSSTRWPTRPVVLGALFTLAAQGHLPWLPGHPHHRPRGRHAALPLLGRPARRVHPGPQVGQAQDAGAGLRHRHGDHPAAGPPAHASSSP